MWNVIIMVLWFSILTGAAEINSPPLRQAHAHNDYNHPRPLLDALDRKFCSIEADIFLTNGLLLVAHESKDVRTDRTLEALYLNPLRRRVLKNKGRIYSDGTAIILLLDFKSEAETTYQALKKVLQPYGSFLTRFEEGKINTKAVTIILTGNRPMQTLASEKNRLAACDSRFEDLGLEPNLHLFPLVSGDWTARFKWIGVGPMPATEKQQLNNLVKQSHRLGRQVRFWKTPDKPEVWRELLDAEVDWIGTDDLNALQKFFRETSKTNSHYRESLTR